MGRRSGGRNNADVPRKVTPSEDVAPDWARDSGGGRSITRAAEYMPGAGVSPPSVPASESSSAFTLRGEATKSLCASVSWKSPR